MAVQGKKSYLKSNLSPTQGLLKPMLFHMQNPGTRTLKFLQLRFTTAFPPDAQCSLASALFSLCFKTETSKIISLHL